MPLVPFGFAVRGLFWANPCFRADGAYFANYKRQIAAPLRQFPSHKAGLGMGLGLRLGLGLGVWGWCAPSAHMAQRTLVSLRVPFPKPFPPPFPCPESFLDRPLATKPSH